MDSPDQGVLWLGETLTVQRIVGAALIAVSVLVFIVVERANQPTPTRVDPLDEPKPSVL